MVCLRKLRKLFRRGSAVYRVVPRVIPRVIRRDEEAQRVEGVLRDMHLSPNSFHIKVSREIVFLVVHFEYLERALGHKA